MDTQSHKTAATSTGHEVHICSRCKWPFPNPHPSAKHRRAHKRVCGTVEGYKLIHSEEEEEEHDRHLSISDDEHASDSENHTPSPNLVKKKAEDFASGDGAGAKSNRSEDDVFSDAVTEFSDSGISPSLVERLVIEEKLLEDDDPIKTAENPDITEQVNDPTRIVEMNLQPDIIKSDVSREIAVETQSVNESDIQREEDKLASITLESEKGEVVSVSEPALTAVVQHESLDALVTPKSIPTETVCENAPLEVKQVSVDEDKTTIEFKKDVDRVEEKPNSVILETANENGEAGGSAVVSDAKISQELSKTESSDDVLEKPVEVLVQSQVILEVPKNIHVTELKEDNNNEVVIVSEKTLDQPIVKDEALPEKQCSNETSLDVEESVDKLNVDYKNVQDKVDEIEGNCGSVSAPLQSNTGVAETNRPSPDTLIIETNSGKPKTEVETFEPPSFMTLVQSGNQDKADEKEGWFPSLTNASKESEGRKKNEEIIAKVTNSSPMKQRHGSLKTLLDEVNSPNKKQVPDFDEDANQKNRTEKPNKEEVNGNNKHVEEWDSPAKYPIEIKKEKKTKKGKPFWVPFMCCSSAASREI
ncbi:hypothetical protein ABFX02_07G076400 [Erythranthe guttata]